LRVEHQRLLLFQLWCDIPLAVDERLLAYVPGGDRLPVGVADLEVITEYLVEPDLERPDPRALPFELLESGDPVAGGPRAVHDAVELLIEACPKHAAVLPRRSRSSHRSRLRSGGSSQRRSSRAPIGVAASPTISATRSSALPGRSAESPRLRRVGGSRCMNACGCSACSRRLPGSSRK